MTLGPAASAWLRNSLVHRLREHESDERRCRKAYREGTPLGTAARRLADAHAEAAQVYRRALRRLDAEEGREDELCTDPACECHGGPTLRCV
jgi:hypothetical protein